jgi:predicted GH43/DUF377 family glycosyl hydrolase
LKTKMNPITINRLNIKIEPDATRVLIRPFIPSPERVVKIMARIAAQPESDVKEHLAKIFADFSGRHIEVEQTFIRRYQDVQHLNFTDAEPSDDRKLLIGSYLTSEYSLESAALFNPSMVPHPDQSSLEDGSVRFIMSLRAVGEGHVSSVAFRTGTIDIDNTVQIDSPTRFAEAPIPVTNMRFDKAVLAQKLLDMKFSNDYSDRVFLLLENEFTFRQLQEAIHELHTREPALSMANSNTKENLSWIAEANYDVAFKANVPISGRSLFPNAPSERHGIEDARFVKFVATNGSIRFYATATAWDGKNILSLMIETDDFQTFRVRTLNGEAVHNKGMALFPRKIHGSYAMIARQDNENIYLMFSKYVQFWRDKQIIAKPKFPWEFYQVGNCGSPIETKDGWLLLTHGVGAMRRYSIGALLLDINDPSKVIGRSREPILIPNENEREGYVPNVVYSCGAMRHGAKLILPYAMADYASRIAIVDIDELLAYIKNP